jgi:H+/gluconate symporter-like permease
MHFTKPFGMLAGAIMIALALAAPVIDGAADAVRNSVLHILATADGGDCSGRRTGCA